MRGNLDFLYSWNVHVIHMDMSCLVKDPACNMRLSYDISQLIHIAGNALWRRLWRKYEINMLDFTSIKFEKKVKKLFQSSPKSH